MTQTRKAIYVLLHYALCGGGIATMIWWFFELPMPDDFPLPYILGLSGGWVLNDFIRR